MGTVVGTVSVQRVVRRRRPLRLASLAFLIVVAGACSTETSDSGAACGDEHFEVPTPQVLAEGRGTDMDLLWVEHRACSYNADGGANLGVPPTVVPVAGEVAVDAAGDFDASYAIGPARDGHVTADETPLRTKTSLPLPDSGCHRLEVELRDGDLRGRFVAVLETSREACPLVVP